MTANQHDSHSTEKATINGLAVIGFIGLVIAGMLLAVYASRYVPDALSRLSSAVYLSSDRDGENGEEAPAPTEEEPAPQNPVVTPPANDDDDTETPPRTGGPNYVAPTPTYTYTTSQKPLYGLADLALTNVRIGYMRGSTFVESDEVPDGRQLAVKFTVVNTGTNVASGWGMRVEVEGQDTAIGAGALLYPDGTYPRLVRVTNPEEGNVEVSIEIDYNNRVSESNERNNDREIDIDVERD